MPNRIAAAPADKSSGLAGWRYRRARKRYVRRLAAGLMAAVDPNLNANPQSLADALAGTDGLGNALLYALAAMFYDSNMFGRSIDYAFVEGSNTSSSRLDQITSLAKLWTRTAKLKDGNDYDALDMLRTCTKWVLSQNLHINDDEKNSVNFNKAAPAS